MQASPDREARAGAAQVSVVMPMRNPGSFLRAAIDSVLSQGVDGLELVIVDDGSTDGSAAYVAGLQDARIRMIAGPCKGISAGMNAGLGHASGDILMRCDADDLYPPGRIAAHVDWLSRHPDDVAVCGGFSMIGADGSAISSPIAHFSETVPDAAPRILDRRLWTHLCTFSFRRSVLERIGGFREYFETSEDADFLLRLAASGPVAYLPADAYLYRIHGTSITHTGASLRRRFFEDAAHAMSRDRLATGSDVLMRGEPPPLPPVEQSASPATSAGEHVARLLVGAAWQAFAKRRRLAAFRLAARAVRACPRWPVAWKSLVLVCIKPAPRR